MRGNLLWLAITVVVVTVVTVAGVLGYQALEGLGR